MTFDEFRKTASFPRFAAAVADENSRREEAFLALPRRVCGLWLRPMTPDDLLMLHGCENPFVAGGEATASAIAQFLAVMVAPPARLPLFKRWSAEAKRVNAQRPRSKAFFRHVAALPFTASVEEIRAYVTRMFADALSPDRDGLLTIQSGLCFLAPLVVEMVEAGWREREVRSMPFTSLLQYRAAARLRAGETGAMTPSERIRCECVAAAHNELNSAPPAAPGNSNPLPVPVAAS